MKKFSRFAHQVESYEAVKLSGRYYLNLPYVKKKNEVRRQIVEREMQLAELNIQLEIERTKAHQAVGTNHDQYTVQYVRLDPRHLPTKIATRTKHVRQLSTEPHQTSIRPRPDGAQQIANSFPIRDQKLLVMF